MAAIFSDHLASARIYSFALLISNIESWLVWGIIPTLIATWLATLLSAGQIRLARLALCGRRDVVGIAFSGGAGVDANVFFDADIALSLCAALAFAHFGARGGRSQALAAALLLLPLAGGSLSAASSEEWRDPDFWLHPMAERSPRRPATTSRSFDARPGRALCETLSFCYWAGKPAEVDVFNTGQQFATGARSDADLIRRIDAHDFSVMEFDTLDPFALGPRVKAAVLNAYRIDHTNDEGVFLVPRLKTARP